MRLLLLFLTITSLNVHAFPRQIRDTTAPHWKKHPPFFVPYGSTNIARGKRVTSSDDFPIIGALSQITDGAKEVSEGNWVELGPGTQWVQIDLRYPSRIYGVHLWHYFGEMRVFRDVILQVADNEDFTKNVRTLYNNDHDDTSGFGKGKDKEYFEHNTGFIMDTRGKNYQGVIARYVRLYSRGNSSDPQNQYTEVEVIGQVINGKTQRRSEAEKLRDGDLRYWTFRRLMPLSDSNASSRLTPISSPLPRFLVPRNAYDASETRGETLTFSSQAEINHEQMKKFGYSPSYHKDWVILPAGLQWMQVDLGRPHRIYAIQLWHMAIEWRIYHDVIVQVADDAAFSKNVRTLWNNDRDNSARLGKGYDREYVETPNGLIIDARGPRLEGVVAQYVRFYSRGSNHNNLNYYCGFDIAVIPMPLRPEGRNDLEEWKTSLPPGPYINR